MKKESSPAVSLGDSDGPPQKRRYIRRKPLVSAEIVVPLNYQPNNFDPSFNPILSTEEIVLSQDNTKALSARTGAAIIEKGHNIYMLCEPPTEPFYLAKVLGFTRSTKTNEIMVNVLWYYRARDLNRRCSDSRLVYASLHRDTCPITSYRGHIAVEHKANIQDVRIFRKGPDRFYFDKLYDRYMFKMYEMIPTRDLLNLPPHYQTALNKRFQFVFIENGKLDELFSSPKHCDKCMQWCSSNECIQCSECDKNYHLTCCDPPLTEKPKRGFAWYCVKCYEKHTSGEDEEENDEDNSGEGAEHMKQEEIDAKTKVSPKPEQITIKYEQLARKFLEQDSVNSIAKRRALEEWPWRYLGVYAKLEDALDLQDRPYARASSRLGGKYQCTSISDEWYGHTIQYYDTKTPPKVIRRGRQSHRKPGRKKKKPDLNDGGVDRDFGTGEINQEMPIPEQYQHLKQSELPPWLKPRPAGYVDRGGDETSVLLWKMPENDPQIVMDYMIKCKPIATAIGVDYRTPNFLDICLRSLLNNGYNAQAAFDNILTVTRESLEEPTFNEEEVRLFEEGVSLYGSELHLVTKHVKTQPAAMVVRFYYNWKKTTQGRQIWGNFSGRLKNRRKQKFIDGIDQQGDDGCYDSVEIEKRGIFFKCMHCETNHSQKWLCAPGAKLLKENLMEGLCLRCGILWRKYATKWEDPLVVLKREDKKYDYLIKKGTENELIRNAVLVMSNRNAVDASPRQDYKTEFKTTERDVDYIIEDFPMTPVDLK